MLKFRALFFIISSFVFAATILSQTTKLSGRVDDAVNAPVAGATVTLKNKTTGAETSVVTDNTGRFLFEAVADPTNYELVVAASGFGRTVRQLSSGDADIVI